MDGPTDELVQRLLAAAAARAGAGTDASRLVERALEEAEAEVRELIKAAHKAVLLRRVVQRLENDVAPAGRTPAYMSAKPAERSELPPPHEGTTACYVYAITHSAWGAPPPDLRGVEGKPGLQTVRHDDLQAIVCDVSLAEFGPGAIDERLKDLAWVEEKVRAHDLAVKALSAVGTVIPCRFCTILPTPDDAAAALRRHRDLIVRTLDAIDGRTEWGVKLMADTRAAALVQVESPIEPEARPDPGAGRAYLAQKKGQGRRRDDVLRAAAAAAEVVHRDLFALASDAAVLPTRDRGGSARGWHLALNAAYLVPNADTGAFQARVDALAQRYRPQGLRIDLTGPWPPYNFSALDLSGTSA